LQSSFGPLDILVLAIKQKETAPRALRVGAVTLFKRILCA